MSIRQSLWIIFLLTSQVALVAQTIDSTVVRKVDSLIQVNRSLVSSGNLKEALAIIREADSLAVEKLGTKNVSHALCVFNIGRTYDYAGRSVETKENYLEAIRLWEKEIGQLDAGYCWALNNMAIYHLERYQYEEAAPYYARCIEASEKILGNNNRDYGFFLTNWANYFKAKAQFEAELKLRYKAKDVFENASGKGSDDYAWCLIELSNCYQAMGRYGQVTEMLLEAQAAMGNSLGTSHRYYASCLNNLATNYERTGEFSKVEPLYKEAINIILNRTPLNQQSYGLFSNNLAVYYYKIGQYEDSEHIFVSLREVWRKAFGEKSTSFAFYITNHANLYLRQERYEMADSLFRMAMDIRRELAVTQHPNYANILYGLGSVKLETGDPTEAEKLFLEAKDIYAATQGMEHPNYSKSLRGLANAYAAQGKCLEADTTMLDAVNILSRSVDKQHPKYVATLSDLASNYLRCGQTVRAGTPLMETEVLNRLYMSRAQYFLTEQEMDQYVKGSVQQTESFLSYLYNQKTTSSGLLQTAWDDALFYKGMLQEKNRSLQFFIQNTSDSVQTISDHWKSCHRGLADLYAKSPAQRDSSSVAILQRQAAEAEKQLVRLSAGFAEARRQVSVTEVAHSLEKNEAAIEFLQFHFYDSRNQKTDSTRYVAMVVLPNDTVPAWIPLFEEKQLQALLDKTGDKAQATSTLYAARTGKVLDQAPAYGTELYNLIWRPLDSLLRGVKTVYFAPSGLLHRVSFGALPINSKKVLANKYELHQLGSTRSLVVNTPQPVPQNYSAAVFGGVQYDRKPKTADSAVSEITDNHLWTYIDRPRGNANLGFEYLPGTQREIDLLEKALQHNKVLVQTHTGTAATEEALKALGHDTVLSPDILHIATHGFFFPDPEQRQEQQLGEENAFKWNENPLFRSGLAMAGANTAWRGEPTPGNLEDGIATAYEISHLNLSNTKLVVLSACESGLGDVKGSEGVYGLQRAFKMAGADYLLVSLWQVPDQETAEFMEVFYKHWLGGKTVNGAFTKAQKKMRKKYKEVYKWGAWVLVE